MTLAHLHAVPQEAAPPRIGEKLITAGTITPDQLRIALHEQRDKGDLLGAVLVRLGFLNENTLASHLAARTGLQRVELSRFVLDPALLQRLPREIAERCCALPLSLKDGVLEIAMADPDDVVAHDAIRRHFPREIDIVPFIANASDIQSAIEDYYGFAGSLDGILSELEQNTATTDSAHPMVRLVNALLGEAVKQGASDVHFEPDQHQIGVRYRLDGVLQHVRALHLAHWPALSQRLKLMSGMNIAEHRNVQDGRFGLVCGGRQIDFRVSLMPTVWGENIVVRVLDQRRALLTLGELGFSAPTIETLTQVIERPQGLTLVTGPTGSGKTTTLYSVLSKLNSSEVHVATLEEPVEYQLGLVRQTAIAEDIGLDFASGIRAILRQDPDIIFIGEIRDADTAQMAMRAALTGHQVFATLHCNDVWSAVPRLVDLGASPRLLAGQLCGIVAQRLVRTLCPHCKVSSPASAEDCRSLHCDPAKPPLLCVPIGCDRCRQTGRKGRTVIAEILRLTPELDDMIAADSGRVVLMEQAAKQGFRSIQTDGIARVLKGDIALADLRRAVDMTRGF